MTNFSERNKLNTPKKIQLHNIDEDLKTRIWNTVNAVLFESTDAIRGGGWSYSAESLIKNIWEEVFVQDIDDLGGVYDMKKEFKKIYFTLPWHKIYSLIEFILHYNKNKYNFCLLFTEKVNEIFIVENSGYRIVNGIISRITNELEISEIKKSLNLTDKYLPVRQHITTGLKFLSDTQNPHYRNSVKESISAVESVCKIITEKKKATLGQALDIINSKMDLHVGLTNGFKALYGYTSDESGIRHALLDKDNITYEDALFFLVSCSSFVNYLISKFENKNN